SKVIYKLVYCCFQAEDGIRDRNVTGVQTCALPIYDSGGSIDGAVVLAFNLDAEFAEVSDNFRTYGAVAVIALIWITIIGWFVMGRLLAPLTVLRTASAQITGSDDLSRRIPVRGNDDLAALTETFNDMLARLDQAFASQR